MFVSRLLFSTFFNCFPLDSFFLRDFLNMTWRFHALRMFHLRRLKNGPLDNCLVFVGFLFWDSFVREASCDVFPCWRSQFARRVTWAVKSQEVSMLVLFVYEWLT